MKNNVKQTISILSFIFVIFMIPMSELYAQWVKIASMTEGALVVSGNNIFAGDWQNGIFLSTNNGTSWSAVNSGLTVVNIWNGTSYNSYYTPKCFAISINGADDTNIFVGTWGSGVFLSTNNGANWTAVNNGFPNTGGGYGNGDTIITSLVFSGNNLFAGTFSFGVFLSTNNGMSWTQVNNGLTDTSIYALAVLDTNIFAGTYGNGVFLSTNNGTSWTNAGLLNEDVEALAISGTNLFAGTNGDGGVYLSTNNGKNWSVVGSGLINKTVYSFAVSDTNIYIGTFQGVCLSTNNGTSWNGIDFSDMSRPIFSLTISGKNLFAETDEGLWRQSLRDITSVNVRKTEIPSVFSLSQNYPNPFNPMTTISFSLPSKSFVSLKVFDIIGREVVTIVSGEMSAGNYTRQWNATKMASGIYFYRLHAGSYSETK